MVNSIYIQLANFAFVMAAVFNDVLLIRFCLTIANFFLILCAALGWPMWPDASATSNPVPVDTLVWSSIAFALHLWNLCVLILDERGGTRFEDDNCEALYQFFLNRTGVGRRDFYRILTKGSWTRVPRRGTVINTDTDLYLLVDGFVDCEIENWRRRDYSTMDNNNSKSQQSPTRIRLGSGEVFDLRLANVFDVPVGFFNTSFAARTASDNVLLFSWSLDALEEFSHRSPPIIVQTWRNLIAFAVADIAHRPSMTEAERLAHMMTDTRHIDFRVPDKPPPSKRMRCRTFVRWIVRSMDPRPLPGMRHSAIPVLSLQSSQALYKDPRLASSLLEAA